MIAKVFTETTCGRCGKLDSREGAEASVPPVGWAYLHLRYRAEGTGWSGGGRRVDEVLCPACAGLVESALKSPDEKRLREVLVGAYMNATKLEIWQKLHEEKQPCHPCKGEGWFPIPHSPTSAVTTDRCSNCMGTGSVPRFPQLGKVCPCISPLGPEQESSCKVCFAAHTHMEKVCQSCSGTGIVLDPDKCHLETLLEAMRLEGFPFEIEADSSGVIFRLHKPDGSFTLTDDFSPTLDMLVVLDAAVKALKKEKSR